MKKLKKKGSGLLDNIVIFGFLFGMAICSVLGLYVINIFTDNFNSQIDNPIVEEHTQSYQEKNQSIMDGMIILFFVILVLGSVVTNLYLDSSPVYFIIFFLLSLLVMFLMIPFSTIIENMEGSVFQATYEYFPMTMFLVDNAVIVMVLYIIIIGISLYMKQRFIG